MKLSYSLAFVSALLLIGCSPVTLTPQTTYLINQPPTGLPVKSKSYKTIWVNAPTALPAYSGTQMAYSTHPYQIAYFVKNRWAETPSQMLQPLIVKSLQNTHYYRAVISTPYISRYDYVLNTEIIKMQQDFTHHPAEFQWVVRAQMVNAATGRLMWTHEFSVSEPLPSNTPYGGVIAANHATAQLIGELVEYCIK